MKEQVQEKVSDTLWIKLQVRVIGSRGRKSKYAASLRSSILGALVVCVILSFLFIGISYLPGNNAFTPLQMAELHAGGLGRPAGPNEFRYRSLTGYHNDYPSTMRLLAESVPLVLLFTFIAFMIFYTGKVSRFRKVFFAATGVLTLFIYLTAPAGSSFFALFTHGAKSLGKCYYDEAFMDVPRPFYDAVFGYQSIFGTRSVDGWWQFLPCSFAAFWIFYIAIFGRGWCAWQCPFGGIDETFANVFKKARIKVKTLNPIFRYFPYAFLVFTGYAIWKAGLFCMAECVSLGRLGIVEGSLFPKKISGWPQSLWIYALAALLVILFIVLPLLMKKRTQCGLFCPLGALSSLVGSATPVKVRVDNQKCIKCGACILTCPTFSMTEQTRDRGKSWISCTRCGQCIEKCPTGAIAYKIAGTKLDARFAYVILAMIGGALFFRSMLFAAIANIVT